MIVEVFVTAAAIGLLVPLLLPFLAGLVGRSEQVSNWYFSLAAKSMSRPTLAFDDDASLFVRNLQLDSKDGGYGVEVDGWRSVRPISDTIHRVGSSRLTLTDVDKGVTTDPRDLLVGWLEHQHREDGEMTWVVEEDTDGEWGERNRFVRAVIELPIQRPSIPLRPTDTLRPIVDGSGKSRTAESVYEGVRRVFKHRVESLGIVKTAILAGSFLAGFAVYWFTAGPGSVGGGGGTTIGFGAIVLMAAADGDSDEDDGEPADVDGEGLASKASVPPVAKQALTAVVAGVAVLVLLLGLVAWTGAVAATVLVGGFVSGAVLPFIVAQICRYLPDRLNREVGRFWLKLALRGVSEPFVTLTDDREYRLVPGRRVAGDTGERARLEGQWVGLTCSTRPDAWGDAGLDTDEVTDELVLEDGEAAANGLASAGKRPDRMWPTRVKRGGRRGVVPERLRDAAGSTIDDRNDHRPPANKTWVRTGRWLARYADARVGHEALSAHARGVDDHAEGGPPLTETQLILASVGLSAGGLVLGLLMTVIV